MLQGPLDGDRRAPSYHGRPQRLLGVVAACGERHQRGFRLIVAHGVFDAAQMAVLLGVSRATAVRVLTDLVGVGVRFTNRGQQPRLSVATTHQQLRVVANKTNQQPLPASHRMQPSTARAAVPAPR